jgi:hypothetical protein
MPIHIFSKQAVRCPDLTESRIAFIVETMKKRIHIIVGAEINKFVSTTIRTSERDLVVIVTMMVTTAAGGSSLSIGATPIATKLDSILVSKHSFIQGGGQSWLDHRHRLLVWLSVPQEFSVIQHHSNP